jgi:hypothetical protein
MAITHSVLAWILLGLLLSWMITFAVLALHPQTSEKVTLEDLPTPSHTYPVITAPTILSVLAPQRLKPQVEAISVEPASD